MATVTTSGLVEKVRAFIRSEHFPFIRLGVAFVTCFIFVSLSLSVHSSPQFRDMDAGFRWLVALYAAKVVLTGACAFIAFEEPVNRQRRVIGFNYLLCSVLRVSAALLILTSEAHFVGHGIRGGVWVALIGYQFLAALINLVAAYGTRFGFALFNFKARRQARWEKALVADLMRSLKD